jgi:hypothetical protein
MIVAILLSLDSMIAGAALRFFGAHRKYWAFAGSAIGLADLLALFLGRALHNVIVTRVSASSQGMLFGGCAVTAIMLGRLCTRYPRATVLGMAVLFSIDNLLAGARLPSFTSAVQLAPFVAISSGLGCVTGLHFAQRVTVHLKPRLSFGLASMAACVVFLNSLAS